MELDLHIVAANENQTPVAIVAYQVAGLIKFPTRIEFWFEQR